MQEEALPNQSGSTQANPSSNPQSSLEVLLANSDPQKAFDTEPLVELGLKDLVAIATGKKYKKKLEAELLNTLTTNKDVLAGLADLVNADSNRPYYDLADPSTRMHSLRVRTAVASFGITLEEFAAIEIKVELTMQLRTARDLLLSQADVMQEEVHDVAKHIIALVNEGKENLSAYDEPFDYATFRKAKNEAVESARTLRLRDDSLRDALDKLETMCWMIEAQAVISKQKTHTGVVLSSANELLDRANKECKMAPLYVSLSSNKPVAVVVSKQTRKVGATKETQAPVQEHTSDDPTQLVLRFFEQEEKYLLKPDSANDLIARLTTQTPNHKNAEKLVQLLQNLRQVVGRGDTDALEQVLDMMFEFKFNTTRAFECLSQLQKELDKVNREVEAFVSLQQKAQQANPRTTGASVKHRSILNSLRDDTNERLDVQKARDVLESIRSLPEGMQTRYQLQIGELDEKVAAVDKLRGKAKELRAKLLKQKPSSGKSDAIIADFEKLIKDFGQLEFTSDDLRRDLERLLCLVKAFALLDSKSYDGLSRNYESWKATLESIKDFGGSIATAIESKIKTARSFLKMFEKIKISDRSKAGIASQAGKVDKDSLPNLLEAEDMIKQVHRHCREIDFSTERTYIESMVDSVHKKLKSFGIQVVNSHHTAIATEETHSHDELAEEPVQTAASVSYRQITPQIKFEPTEQLMLHELQSAMDYFKRTPLNLRVESAALSEIERKGLDFVQKVRELPPDQFLARRDDMQHIYDSLGVRVLEWDDMVAKAKAEQQSVQEISLALKNKDIDLQTIQELRKSYEKFEFAKDIKIEARTMLVYLQVLQREYERRQDVFVRDEVKPAIDFHALKGLIKELQELVERIKIHSAQDKDLSSAESEINLKTDLFALTDHSKFLMELHNEIKKYLETEVYSSGLADLDLSKIKTTFNKFVDLTVMILDYKTELEIRDRNRSQPEKPFPYKPKTTETPSNNQFMGRDQKGREAKPLARDQSLGGTAGHGPQVITNDVFVHPIRKISHPQDADHKIDHPGLPEHSSMAQEPIPFENAPAVGQAKPLYGKFFS